MGRRKISMAALFAMNILERGTAACVPIVPVHDAALLHVWFNFETSTLEMLVESPSFEGGDVDSMETAKPFCPLFQKSTTPEKTASLWGCGRLVADSDGPVFGGEWNMRGVYTSRERASQACTSPTRDFVFPLVLDQPPPGTTTLEGGSFPFISRAQTAALDAESAGCDVELEDESDRRGEVPGA